MAQIRFLKRYVALLDGHAAPVLKDVGARNSYAYEKGDIPGLPPAGDPYGTPTPPLPNREVEISVPKEAKGKPVFIEVEKGGEIRRVRDEVIKTVLLYDHLVAEGVAQMLSAGSAVADYSDEETALLQMEAASGIDLVDLDTIYRERGARTVGQKVNVLNALREESSRAEAAAVARS